jgi:hypothetical protein
MARSEGGFTEALITTRGPTMAAPIWDDQVQVRIIEMQPIISAIPRLSRVLWDGISLAEAVRRWLQLPPEDQGLVMIFGQETFVGQKLTI